MRDSVLDLRQPAVDAVLQLPHLIPRRERQEQQHGDARHDGAKHHFDRQERTTRGRSCSIHGALVLTKMSGPRHAPSNRFTTQRYLMVMYPSLTAAAGKLVRPN